MANEDKKLNSADNRPWKEYKVPRDEPLYLQIGCLDLWIINSENELRIAHTHKNAETEMPSNGDNPPDDIEWKRWPVTNKEVTISLSPIFPDRAVVVRPEHAFRLMNEAKSKIYIDIPCWVRIDFKVGKTIHTLMEIPSSILSNTWFGDFFEGNLCYWISSQAKQVPPTLENGKGHSVICPIKIINSAEKDLFVEAFTLRTSNLSLYIDKNNLWSDETTIDYQGEEGKTNIEFSGKPPKESLRAKLITAPRQKSKFELLKRAFYHRGQFSDFA